MASPYEVLLVAPDADTGEIERAYRERVKQAHPDQGGSVEEFRRVRTAYEQLKAGHVPEDGEGASFREGGPAEGEDGEGTRREYAATEVTYLNYDVLADHGWGADDPDLFGKAARADLAEADYGEFRVDPGESLLEAAENRGHVWPFACRGGACANCAIKLVEGELSMPVNHILPVELMEQDIRLSCNGMPITDELKVVYNVKHMPILEELLLPPRPFEQAYTDD
ncbi:ferredoxin [Halobacteriales archaeon SW_10_68_16]|jgi:curved DNA-binding protein CbpA|nr:MAG: ferredoxin [Halobacteriales archaeon SW_10_68_16]